MNSINSNFGQYVSPAWFKYSSCAALTPPAPEKVKALKPALKKKKVSKKKPQKAVFKAVQGQGQEPNSSEKEKESEQSDQEASPQEEERKEVRRALELEPVTADYLIRDLDFKQIFDSSLSKAKGARYAIKESCLKRSRHFFGRRWSKNWRSLEEKIKNNKIKV